jgi:uncharacterized membrane protein YeaQ/YmgE (transglycosylase-associated protein family)
MRLPLPTTLRRASAPRNVRDMLGTLIAWIVVGVIAGWLASKIMGSERGCLGNLLLGLVGAIIGGILFSLLGLGGATNIIGSIVIATIGAVLVLAIVGRR